MASTPPATQGPDVMPNLLMQLTTGTLREKLRDLETQNQRLQLKNQELKRSITDMDDEQADVFVYIHEKLDEYYEQIAEYEEKTGRLERQLEDAQRRRDHEIAEGRTAAEGEIRRLQRELDNLRDQLARVHSFQEERETVLEEIDRLRSELDEKGHSADERVAALERKHIAERQRLKGEMLQRLRETKEAILAETVQQLHDTTKRTLAENEQMTTELAYQSREVERLVHDNDSLRSENGRLQRQAELHERALEESAHRTHLLQRMVKTLHRRIRSLEAEQRAEAKKKKKQKSDGNPKIDHEKESEGADVEAGGSLPSPQFTAAPPTAATRSHHARGASPGQLSSQSLRERSPSRKLRRQLRQTQQRVVELEREVQAWRRAWERSMKAQGTGVLLLTETLAQFHDETTAAAEANRRSLPLEPRADAPALLRWLGAGPSLASVVTTLKDRLDRVWRERDSWSIPINRPRLEPVAATSGRSRVAEGAPARSPLRRGRALPPVGPRADASLSLSSLASLSIASSGRDHDAAPARHPLRNKPSSPRQPPAGGVGIGASLSTLPSELDSFSIGSLPRPSAPPGPAPARSSPRPNPGTRTRAKPSLPE